MVRAQYLADDPTSIQLVRPLSFASSGDLFARWHEAVHHRGLDGPAVTVFSVCWQHGEVGPTCLRGALDGPVLD
eukprot:12717515-Alexandrium_andersonii.AAC.1